MKLSARRAGLLVAGLILGSLFAACPVSRQLILRPLFAAFDSSYVSGTVQPMPFDRDLWRQGKARHRVGMAEYLVSNKVLNGMSRASLIEMLGQPDVDPPGGEEPRWLLGYHAKGLFDESIWLGVTISQDRVTSDGTVFESWDDPRER